MNISAKVKSTNPPNYIFNFNIDIPLKYKSTFTNRSNQTSPSKSPGKFINQKKYKLSSITPRPNVTLNTNGLKKSQKSAKKQLQKQKINVKAQKISNKQSLKQKQKSTHISKQQKNQKDKKCQTNTKLSKTIIMKQQYLQKDLYQINNFNFYHQNHNILNSTLNNEKKQSPSISRKTQKISSNNNKKYLNQEEICPSRKTVKNVHLNNKKEQKNSGREYRNIEEEFQQVQRKINKMNQEQGNNSQTNSKKNIIRNISVLQKLMTDDYNIKYPTDQSQLKRKSPQSNNYPQNKNNIFQNALLQANSNNQNNQSDLQQFNLKQMKMFFNFNRLSTIYDQELNLNQIRQYQQISTQRKQRLNYAYLKQKILIESSVKKIQRAWRNYQTKKLVNSYSQTLKSKFLLKNDIIKSARSQTNALKIFKNPINNVNNSYSLSNYQNKPKLNNYFQEENSQSSESQDYEKIKSNNHYKFSGPFNKKNKVSQGITQQKNNASFFESPLSTKKIVFPKKQIPVKNQQQIQNKKINQKQVQDKLRKFQEQQIKKWQSILQSIKKGSNIQNLLQKSQTYKRQLEHNLKSFNVKLDKNRASPILFRNNSSKSSLSYLENQKQSNIISYQPSPSTIIQKTEQFTPMNQKKQFEKKQKQIQLNETEQRRKQKIMFFQNQILKIDNQQYSDVSSVSCQSLKMIDIYKQKSQKHTDYEELQQRQREENMKLRKKLELFNTHFLDLSSADEGLTDRSLKAMKGQSNEQRRTAPNNKVRNLNLNNNRIRIQQEYNIEQNQPPSEQNRRPDITILEDNQKLNQIQKQNHLQKIKNLINKKVQYPSSQEDSSLDINLRKNEQIQYQQYQSGSDTYYNEYEQLDNKFLQPALTHRQRKYQVPQLNLNNLSSKQKRENEEVEIQIIKKDNKQSLKNQEQEAKKKRVDQFLTNFQLLDIKIQKKQKQIKKIPKVQMNDALKMCKFFEEQLIYQVLLQFSDSQKIVQNIKGLFQNYRKQQKKNKPEGICTNLQSIKDYLQNFVGFIYQNNLTGQIQSNLYVANGPTVEELLKFLRKDSDFQNSQNEYIMNINIFQKHWKYANANIYFDKKYTDQKSQQERVNYLKGLTRVYFRAIFDAFNQSLQFQRSYGLTGQSYPWSNKVNRQNKKTLKIAFQQAYRRILKLSVVYCGVHFDQKAQLVNQESIKQIQEQRLITLLTMQLQEDEYRWNFFQDQHAQVKYDMGLAIQQILIEQIMKQFKQIFQKKF